MFLNVLFYSTGMDVTFADKLGMEDRQIIGVSIVDNELKLNLDKPDSMGWQELIYFIKYVIAQALAESSADLNIGDIFQWLGAQGIVSDEVEKSASELQEDIIARAREHRLKQMALSDDSLKLDTVDRRVV